VGLLGRGQQVPSPPARRSEEQCKLSHAVSSPRWGPGQPLKIWIFEHLFLGPQKSRQNGLCYILFFFDRAPQYVVNEGADNKLNSVHALPVDIESVVMSPSAHRYDL